MKRALVVGATGQTGTRIVRILRREGIEAIGAGHRNPSDRSLSLENRGEGARLIRDVRPDAILIPGGWTNVDRCEEDPETATAVNAAGPHEIAEEAAKVGAYVLYVSTDYVFDGEDGPYSEEAEPEPINLYGKSKLEGERRVLSASSKFAIARTSSVYSYDLDHPNFLMHAVRNLGRGKAQPAFEDQWLTPTWAQSLAAALVELAKDRRPGRFHVAGPEFMNRVEFCRRVARAFGYSRDLIRAVPTASVPLPARRPLRSGLAMHSTCLETPMIPLSEALERISADAIPFRSGS